MTRAGGSGCGRPNRSRRGTSCRRATRRSCPGTGGSSASALVLPRSLCGSSGGNAGVPEPFAFRGDVPPRTRSQIADLQAAKHHATELRDFVADGIEQPADLAVLALDEIDAEVRLASRRLAYLNTRGPQTIAAPAFTRRFEAG